MTDKTWTARIQAASVQGIRQMMQLMQRSRLGSHLGGVDLLDGH